MKRLALGFGLVVLLLSPLTAGPVAAAEAPKSLYISPSEGSYPMNGMFAVEIRSNSGSTAVNSVQVAMTYTNEVQFVSVSSEGSGYNVDAQKKGGGGTVTVSRGSSRPISGDQLVAKVSFKVISTGVASMVIDGSRSKLVSASGQQNVARTFGEGDYILVPAASGSAKAPIPSGSTVPTPGSGSSPNVSISSNGSSDRNILPDESEIDVAKPSTIETTPNEDKTVQKVQYLINGRVVMTVEEPPYSYSVDTTNLRNGKYRLTTKTFYTDGSNDSTDSILNVSNALSAKQLGLQLRHYAWLIILLILAAGAFVYFRFFKSRDTFGDGYDDSDAADMGLDKVEVPPGSRMPADPNGPQNSDSPRPTNLYDQR